MIYALVQASDSSAGAAGASLLSSLFALGLGVLLLASLWRIFTKAGQPGWACIIPIYNTVVLLRIIGKPWWWLLLLCVPFVNLVIGIIVTVELAKAFGKGVGFALGMLFLSIVFYPILGLGGARYLGPARA